MPPTITHNFRYLAVILPILFLASCNLKPADRLALVDYNFALLNDWQATPLHLKSFQNSCRKMIKLPADFNFGLVGKAADWKRVCAEAQKPNLNAKEFFEKNFYVFLITNDGNPDSFFTGYYEPVVNGSKTKKGKFIYPIYTAPPDMKNGQQYLTRERIDKGALNGMNLELAYLDDPVKLFFMQIQGSGLVMLEDGSYMRVGFAARNGWQYISIGKYLVDNGLLTSENSSAQNIKQWLYSHPQQMQEVLWQNKSYVFFHEVKGEGPIGAMGVPLTAEASIAVDDAFIPFGVPIWVETQLPATELSAPDNYNHLLIAQDKGIAIKGPIRADIFFGHGRRAEMLAGNMKEHGRMYILLPRVYQ